MKPDASHRIDCTMISPHVESARRGVFTSAVHTKISGDTNVQLTRDDESSQTVNI